MTTFDTSQFALFPCRSCGHSGPNEVVISLGSLPLGSALLEEPDLEMDEQHFPLDLAMCGICSLLQVQTAVPSGDFSKQNYYITLSSGTVLQQAEELADSLVISHGLGIGSLVVEIGSNNGTLLDRFKTKNVPVLGIEPVEELAQEAEELYGIPTVRNLFSEDLALSIAASGKSADVVVANYVLELIPDLRDFCRGLKALLKENGTVVIEVPYVRDMAEQCRLDGIAHFRVNWFSLTTISNLFRSHGLEIWHVEHISGFRSGTLRIYAAHVQSSTVKASVRALLEEEGDLAVNTPGYYRELQQRFSAMRKSIRSFLSELRTEDGVRVAAFGAGTKASNFLNYAGLNKEFVDFVVDDTPYKQGMFMPGVHLPIHSPGILLDGVRSYVLMLALDFTDEILARHVEFREQGGRFIIPGDKIQIV